MELQKIAIIGTYLSFLWFIPVLYISKRSLTWKVEKLRLFTFIPTIGAYMFVIGITIKLFIDKSYIHFELNHFNVLILIFLALQTFVTVIMEIFSNRYKERIVGFQDKEIRKLEQYYYFGFTILFALDMLVRFELYRLTF